MTIAYYWWKHRFYRLVRDPASGFLQIGRKLNKWQSCHNLSTWRHCQTFLLSILVTGPNFMSISSLVPELWQFFFYKGLNRNQEIQNFPVWVLPNILRVGWVRGIKFGTNVSNKMLLNVAKGQCYSFYHFWFIKGKPTKEGGGGGKFTVPPPIQIRVKAGRLTQKLINNAAFTRNRLCHKKQDGFRQ